MPVYEYECDRCGKVVEVFAQTATQMNEPTTCTCGQTGGYFRRFSTFATVSGVQHGSDHGECRKEPGGDCGMGGCYCGHQHN